MVESIKPKTIKFLCSYGGRILPRYPDGKLRYQGGETRVLAVNRSISFAELLVKLGELCGGSVSLRCQLPMEDLDALVSITSDEDLINLIEEYDQTDSLKIRAFLSFPKVSPAGSVSTASSSSTATIDAVSPKSKSPSTPRRSRCPIVPVYYNKSAGKQLPYYVQANPGRIYLVHNGNHWQ